MSIRVSSWVWDDAPTDDPHEAMVLLCLADHANDDGTGCWPSVTTMARKTRLSKRKVQYVLRALEGKGLIRRGNQQLSRRHLNGQRPTVYDVLIPVTHAQRARVGMHVVQEGGAQRAGVPVHVRAPEPSFKPSVNQGAATCSVHLLTLPCRGCAADSKVKEATA